MINPVTIIIVYSTPFLYVACQFVVLLLWRGRLRWAATIPLLGWAVWIALLQGEASQETASYNRPPIEAQVEELLFELFWGSIAGLAFLGFLFLFYRLRGNYEQNAS